MSKKIIKEGHSRIFTFLVVSVIFFILIVSLNYLGLNTKLESAPYRTLVEMMKIYIGVVFARSFAHLILSFAHIMTSKKDFKLDRYPLVSILVPSYNEEKVIEKAIRSINNLSYPNFEVLLIDDGSKDNTLEVASKLLTLRRVRVLHQQNAGKAEALNFGIKHAQGDFILCVDADSVLSRNVLEQGMKHLLKNPKLGAVAGGVHIGNKTNLLCRFQQLEYIAGLNFLKRAQAFLGIVSIIPGPVGLFRKKIVQDLGGYRSDTFAEDCDLSIRILLKGHQTYYEPEMKAWTEAPEDSNSLMKQRYRWTRGIVQALRDNSEPLFSPLKNPRGFVVLAYTFFETIFIPVCNFSFAVLSINYALMYNDYSIFAYFFAELTMLEMILSFYAISTEKTLRLDLIALGAVNRVTFGFALEIMKFFSLIDELFGVPMNWGKLERKGMKEAT